MGTLKYIFVFGFLVLCSFQPTQDYETISWQADQRLSWSDFQGKVPASARAAATTASGITYRYSASGTQANVVVDFDISTHFYPSKSWYQPQLCDEVILSHEQLHFDISELYARKMRKRLVQETFTRKNVKAKVKSIYRQINQELADFQNQYDEETNFSRDREAQAVWNAKIAEALKK